VYNGYYIPKGTGLVLNVHTLHRNEERYPNAWVSTRSSADISTNLSPHSEQFNPDRYLGDDLSCMESAHQPDAMMRDHWTFGAGYVK
jgi:cytochrome P450